MRISSRLASAGRRSAAPILAPSGAPSVAALLAVTLLAAAGSLAPAARAGTVAEFLRLGVGARALALGEGMLSVEHDPSALYWNPALMAGSPRPAAEVMHAENFGGAAGFDAVACTVPLGGGPGEAVGIGVLRLSVDDIPTTGNFRFDDVGADGVAGSHDAGEGDGRWEPGEPVHADASAVEWRSDSEWAVLVGYARALGEAGAAGVCAKYLRQAVAGRQSTGFGLDVGAHLALSDGLELAARVSDLTSTRVVWDNGTRESIPPRLELAVARQLRLGRRASVRAVLGAGSDTRDVGRGPREWHGGLEYRLRDRLFLRAGATSGRPTFGAGVGLARFRVDYAALPFHELGATHRLSALARW